MYPCPQCLELPLSIWDIQYTIAMKPLAPLFHFTQLQRCNLRSKIEESM